MYFKPGQDIPLYGNPNAVNLGSNSDNLSIIDLPAMKIQAHCHEGNNGTSHFKEYGEEMHIPMLNSYEFAMGDLYAEKLGIKRIKK